MHEPFRRALRKHVGDAIIVADAFHVVGVATRELDKDRRVQDETRCHRGRTADPPDRARKLLTEAATGPDEAGTAKLRAAAAPPELRSMGCTLTRWWDQSLNWRLTGASNGPTEALNLLIEREQARRPRLPQLHQLPSPRPALHRRLQLEPPRPRAPPEREERECFELSWG